MKFQILATQGGNTRVIYTEADSTANAIEQILGDLLTGNGNITIVAKPHNAEGAR